MDQGKRTVTAASRAALRCPKAEVEGNGELVRLGADCGRCSVGEQFIYTDWCGAAMAWIQQYWVVGGTATPKIFEHSTVVVFTAAFGARPFGVNGSSPGGAGAFAKTLALKALDEDAHRDQDARIVHPLRLTTSPAAAVTERSRSVGATRCAVRSPSGCQGRDTH